MNKNNIAINLSKFSYMPAATKFCGKKYQIPLSSIMKTQGSYFLRDQSVRFYSPTGMPGSGAGKGGGAGGSVRESGGRLGEYGAAQEEHYFFNKQKEQLEKLKKKGKLDKAGEMSQKQEK